MSKYRIRLVITALATAGMTVAHKLSEWADRLHVASELAVTTADREACVAGHKECYAAAAKASRRAKAAMVRAAQAQRTAEAVVNLALADYYKAIDARDKVYAEQDVRRAELSARHERGLASADISYAQV